jgi:hypothetical protein
MSWLLVRHLWKRYIDIFRSFPSFPPFPPSSSPSSFTPLLDDSFTIEEILRWCNRELEKASPLPDSKHKSNPSLVSKRATVSK